MKTKAEIMRMIDFLMQKANNSDEVDEPICDTIDALLWVIGDNSGYNIANRFGYKER